MIGPLIATNFSVKATDLDEMDCILVDLQIPDPRAEDPVSVLLVVLLDHYQLEALVGISPHVQVVVAVVVMVEVPPEALHLAIIMLLNSRQLQ